MIDHPGDGGDDGFADRSDDGGLPYPDGDAGGTLVPFDPPEFLAEEVRKGGLDACPSCEGPAAFRPLRCVALEIGRHRPADGGRDVFKIGLVARCNRCHGNIRLLIGLPPTADWPIIGLLIGFPEAGMVPPASSGEGLAAELARAIAGVAGVPADGVTLRGAVSQSKPARSVRRTNGKRGGRRGS